MPFSVAIDGLSGSGKSTLAKALAKKYGFIYVDTGALYRAIGLYIQNKCLMSTDVDGIIASLPEIRIEMRLNDGQSEVWLNGSPVGDEIRTPMSSIYASDVSKIPQVRQFLLSLQRDIAAANSVIMDGRDIGTVILPDAQVKIFMTASDEKRALRRYNELVSKGIKTTYDEVLKDVKWRDENDRNRTVAPAVPAPDAVFLDNSGLDAAETVDAASAIIDKALKELSGAVE